MGRHRPAPDPGDEPSRRKPSHVELFLSGPGATAGAEEESAREEFDALVAPHRSALRAYLLRLTNGDEAATNSVIKETFYRAAQDPARYPQRASAVRPWLVLTARMVLRDGDRTAPAGHDDRPLAPPLGERSRVPGKQRPHGNRTTTVVRALNELSVLHRDLLVDLFYRGVSLEEAAAALGVPVESVKSRLYFAMRALRMVLDQQIGERRSED
jgi:RNA polymerase sigma-70 factor, ECF subfamily